MTRPIPPDLQEAFSLFVTRLRNNFGEDLVGVYAIVQDAPHVIAVIEDAMGFIQRASIGIGYTNELNRDIGLTVFTRRQFEQGYPYESDFVYDPVRNRDFVEDVMRHLTDPTHQALNNTALLRSLQHRGHTLAGALMHDVVPLVSDDEYRVVLEHEATERLKTLTTTSTEEILNLCRILAFWRLKLVLPLDEVGAWSLRNLDPRFQSLIERASTEYQSGSEPGAYNAYQLEQFAEYVRDMLKR